MVQANLFGEKLESEPVPKLEFGKNLGEKKRTEQAGLTTQQEGKFISKSAAEKIQKEKEDDLKYSKEYCLNFIEDEMYVWDMRCWDKYKDQKEMEAWINNIESGKRVIDNCGHAVFCIERLLSRNLATKQEIIAAMKRNPHKQYANRFVKCFSDPKDCPKYEEHGYSNCELCH